MPERKRKPGGSGRDRRIFLAYKSARRDAFANDFGPSWAWETIARQFGLPIRHVKDIVADQHRENMEREAKRQAQQGKGKMK